MTELEDATETVVTVKVAEVAPASTVTLAGTVATLALELESVTTAPPVGAARVKVAVPVDGEPPITVVGFTFTADRAAAGGVTVNAAVLFALE